MLKKIKIHITKKEKLVLFPHGTRIKPSSNVNIKPGIFAIYKNLNVPIVPVDESPPLFLRDIDLVVAL